MHGKQPSGLLTQKKMLHSAISLFLEKGYEKATTAEIARGAGHDAECLLSCLSQARRHCFWSW